ncbi:hypothetical protein SADUNF_Sadunf15G0013500 [Salix dunnii]|uniref:Uncharacterized protein n=1 Tax=Salix dunnii TaxID=1413687 RepID=A0A835JCX8_9ROSI|nr:hypothetical protein SADUNF_Sadunf15G0013500 [Salix dunnii]
MHQLLAKLAWLDMVAMIVLQMSMAQISSSRGKNGGVSDHRVGSCASPSSREGLQYGDDDNSNSHDVKENIPVFSPTPNFWCRKENKNPLTNYFLVDPVESIPLNPSISLEKSSLLQVPSTGNNHDVKSLTSSNPKLFHRQLGTKPTEKLRASEPASTTAAGSHCLQVHDHIGGCSSTSK